MARHSIFPTPTLPSRNPELETHMHPIVLMYSVPSNSTFIIIALIQTQDFVSQNRESRDDCVLSTFYCPFHTTMQCCKTAIRQDCVDCWLPRVVPCFVIFYELLMRQIHCHFVSPLHLLCSVFLFSVIRETAVGSIGTDDSRYGVPLSRRISP